MNKETLESILRMAEEHRKGIVRDDYDVRATLTLALSFIIETIKYELDKSKESATQLYK